MKEPTKDIGRPSIYTEELLAKAQAYLDSFYGKAYKKKLEDSDDIEVIPSIEGLALELGIHRSTIYDWKSQEEKKPFSDILEGILSRQAQLLINQGLAGNFNPQITKLALGKHGYKEQSETDLTTGGQPINMTDTQRKAKISSILQSAMNRAKE